MTIPIPEPTMESRFSSLEQASRSLSTEVRNLNEALRILSTLQTEQAAQRQRQDEADEALVLAKQEADARETRTRRTIGGVSVGMAILLPVASILVYFSLINHVNDLLDQQRVGFYKSCMVRNEATKANIAREVALAEADTEPAVKKIHRDSVVALSKGLVDCTVYQR